MSLLDTFQGSALTPRESALLRMSTPENPLVIAAVLWFDGTLDHAGVLSVLETRLGPFTRFRQSIAPAPLGLGPPRWRDVRDFELGAHLQRVDARGRALSDVVSELCSAPLEPGRPLWMAHWIEGVADGGVLVIRVHHCLGDGAALLSLLHALSDEGAAGRDSHSGTWARSPRRARAARQALGIARAVAGALARRDPELAARGPLGTRKVACFSDPLPLDVLLAGARRQRTTLTVLLLAAVTGALQKVRFREAREVLHALLPVNLRAGPSAASNQFASISVPLPIWASDRGERVEALRAALARGDAFGQAQIWAHLTELAGLATPALARYAARLMSRKSTLVVSSIRGPSEVLHWRGSRLEGLGVISPAPGQIALSVGLASYAGRVRLSVQGDARSAAQPSAILRSLEAELALLAQEPGARYSASSDKP